METSRAPETCGGGGDFTFALRDPRACIRPMTCSGRTSLSRLTRARWP